MPVGVAVLVTVAFAVNVTVPELSSVSILVPAGMPAPVTTCPATNPLIDPVGVTVGLPATVNAVNV
jgi:hypothetical protein